MREISQDQTFEKNPLDNRPILGLPLAKNPVCLKICGRDSWRALELSQGSFLASAATRTCAQEADRPAASIRLHTTPQAGAVLSCSPCGLAACRVQPRCLQHFLIRSER